MTLQRKKSILLKRLKSPPAVNQFNYTIDKNQATQLLRLLKKFAEAPWSVAEWVVAPRFDNPRATVLVLLLG